MVGRCRRSATKRAARFQQFPCPHSACYPPQQPVVHAGRAASSSLSAAVRTQETPAPDPWAAYLQAKANQPGATLQPVQCARPQEGPRARKFEEQDDRISSLESHISQLRKNQQALQTEMAASSCKRRCLRFAQSVKASRLRFPSSCRRTWPRCKRHRPPSKRR